MKSIKSFHTFLKTISCITIFVLSLLSFKNVSAQYDPEFSHYMFNEPFINPAYIGSREQLSLTAVIRDQWAGMNGAPKTQTFSIHSPLKNTKNGLGLSFMNDKIGVTHRTVFYPTYAYHIPMKKGKLSIGVTAGIQLYQENLNEVETTSANDVNFLAGTPNLVLPNFGFGTMYYTKNFYVGFSIPRLLKNEIYFDTKRVVTSKLTATTWHYYLTAGLLKKISPQITLKPSVMIKTVYGAPLQADISLNMMFREFFWIGASFRTGDAIVGMIGFQVNKHLRVGYSYDYTLTDLQQFTNGTHEFAIGYDFRFAKNSVVTPRFF